MGKSIIVCGQSGTGKTILALHFVNGRCSQGERTGYIAVEETREDLLDQAAQFGWDLKSYEDRGLFRVYPILEERRVETKYQYDSYSAERGFGGLIDLVDPGTEKCCHRQSGHPRSRHDLVSLPATARLLGVLPQQEEVHLPLHLR